MVVKCGGAPVRHGGAGGTGSVGGLETVRPVDTTAAGDSFNAGFLAAHLAGADTEAAIRAGHKVAMRVIGGRGALVPL